MVELKAKDIAVIGLLSASITIGKLALSLVPNVEIVSLLFIVYTIVFGVKHSIIISIIFSTTEIFIYGLSTWLLGYYFIWPMLIFITHIVKKTVKDEYGYATIAGLFGLFFGVFFAIVESFFYGYAYGLTYWIRGIPFDILHGVSNFIIVLILFNPITKIMIYVYEGFNS
ncbi:MAG: hypothetical protein ACOX0L_03885 [Natronincolaceae bacterium]|jgi:energy-coupling factor transport system substrate-specific component|nr:hypothetical protein [Bacillota bacterium]NLK90147.1 hypothetical protein [Clostridiales bacterium]